MLKLGFEHMKPHGYGSKLSHEESDRETAVVHGSTHQGSSLPIDPQGSRYTNPVEARGLRPRSHKLPAFPLERNPDVTKASLNSTGFVMSQGSRFLPKVFCQFLQGGSDQFWVSQSILGDVPMVHMSPRSIVACHKLELTPSNSTREKHEQLQAPKVARSKLSAETNVDLAKRTGFDEEGPGRSLRKVVVCLVVGWVGGCCACGGL